MGNPSSIKQSIIHFISSYRLLSSEGAALCESCLAARRLAQYCRAAGANDNGLGVLEDVGDLVATGALDVHEE